jgi:hypothetical protein
MAAGFSLKQSVLAAVLIDFFFFLNISFLVFLIKKKLKENQNRES